MSTKLVQSLQSRGWTVRPSTATPPLLPRAVAARYPQVAKPLLTFLASFQKCENAAQNVWFLTRADFRRKPGGGFCWNEYERMGLEQGDDETRVTEFWNHHFPFLLAVHSDYDYLAVRVAKKGFGQIVHGNAPEWESPSPVAASFAEFLKRYTAAALSSSPKYPFSLFL